MILLDANILLYSHHRDMAEHATVYAWLEQQWTKPDPIGLPWISIWAFIRISSNPQLWRTPQPMGELLDRMEEWIAQPNVVVIEPGPRHFALFKSLMLTTNVSGKAPTDATLAALAMEHAATLISTDRDFRRFSGLRWINPLEPA